MLYHIDCSIIIIMHVYYCLYSTRITPITLVTLVQFVNFSMKKNVLSKPKLRHFNSYKTTFGAENYVCKYF